MRALRTWMLASALLPSVAALALTLEPYPVKLAPGDRARLKELACGRGGGFGKVRFEANRYEKETAGKIYVAVNCDSRRKSFDGNIYCDGFPGKWQCDIGLSTPTP